MSSHHVAIWIDHQEAKIFHIEPGSFDATTIKSAAHHLTRKEEGQGQPANHAPFFEEIAAAIGADEGVLVVGPSTAKLQFIRYLHEHNKALEARVLGVESSDHPTDGQMAAYVRHYFHEKKTGSA